MTWGRLAVCLTLSTLTLLGSCVAEISERDIGRRSANSWVDEEFEGINVVNDAARPEESKHPQSVRTRPARVPQKHYYFEAAFVAFLVVYGSMVWVGRKQNEQLALKWAVTYCGDGSILAHNFAQLGPSDNEEGEILMKQSQSSFQLYASGRRHCSSLLATLELRKRQDLLSHAYYVFEPKDDTIEIDVAMNDGNMAAMVLLVAQPKLAKALHKERRDLALYAKQVDVARERVKEWPASRLTVLAESSTLFYDLFLDPILDLAFNTPVFTAVTSLYFRYLLFTTDNDGPAGTPRKLLRFSFKLPKEAAMEELSRLMDLVMKFIDVIAAYRLPPKLQEKADSIRAEERRKALKETRKAAEEDLAKKKQERRDAESERVKKMAPEARSKHEDRQKRIEQQRLLRKRTIKA